MFLFDQLNRAEFSRQVLRTIGLTPTNNRVNFLLAWMSGENTAAAFNPLATTWPLPGATNFNSVGVKNYPSFEHGVYATAKTLLQPSYYSHIREALAADTSKLYDSDPGLEQDFKTWGTGYRLFKYQFKQYGGTVLPGRHVGAFEKHVNYTNALALAALFGGAVMLAKAFEK